MNSLINFFVKKKLKMKEIFFKISKFNFLIHSLVYMKYEIVYMNLYEIKF